MQEEKKGNFVFVLNNINAIGQLPVEVAPGHSFRKAEPTEVKKIKELLQLFRRQPVPVSPFLEYENQVVKVEEKGTKN